jgi:phosphotransferase system  glucose/maltose/N-acetylglucosamine-specific IIC component|tara:strand:- start:1289 stop:1468 length:180 start_codon:yes stop_codon:yes gene_type:complete
MQLKYNRQSSLGSSLLRIFIKILFAIVIFIIAIFLIEKVNFPSPQKKYDIEITNDIKKL